MLSDPIRRGARQIIAAAVEAELQDFLEQYRDRRDEQGRQVVIRNGYLFACTITTGVGEVEIKVPKVRDRSGSGIKFTSQLLPPYLKRSRSVEDLLPWCNSKGCLAATLARRCRRCWEARPRASLQPPLVD